MKDELDEKINQAELKKAAEQMGKPEKLASVWATRKGGEEMREIWDGEASDEGEKVWMKAIYPITVIKKNEKTLWKKSGGEGQKNAK